MHPISFGETGLPAKEVCIGRMVNTIGIRRVGATQDLRTAEIRIQELINSLPGDYVVFHRSTGRVIAKAGPIGGAIERIVELSAEAQIRRREFVQDCPAAHIATGAILAYGQVLGLLWKLQETGPSGLPPDMIGPTTSPQESLSGELMRTSIEAGGYLNGPRAMDQLQETAQGEG